ncbi:cell wall hydrolase [Allosphingosinicella indica]|uniref:Cell Wall Hydrolase n=1 Tax=Allosphingosinicella indica TaxID=941907 RepID=A0A1X7G475_9SPHN|nr:cell wall hydrolase [Allosphingosinicella indica]SMF63707.1 Cell Wall Hydrolase [Allosphingosinicella indica]
MSRNFRVAGFAAAILTLAAGVAYADPSQALDTDVAPITSRYIDHATATIDDAAPQVQTADAERILSHDVDFSTPVAQHAVAAIGGDERGALNGANPGGKMASLASLVEEHGATELGSDDLECLAGAVYFESKGEPLEGQLAVAEVIINRAGSGRFPTSYCGVVKQRGQFSFVRGGQIPSIPKASNAWRKAVAIARIAEDDLAESAGADAMFFHARYVSPGWRNLKRVGTIGNHIFYR